MINPETAGTCPECQQKSLPYIRKDEYNITAIACQNKDCRAIIEVVVSPKLGVTYGQCIGHWRETDDNMGCVAS